MSGNGHYVFATFDNQASGIGGVAVVDVRTRTVVRDWPVSRHRAPAWNLAFPEEAPVLNRYFSLDPSST